MKIGTVLLTACFFLPVLFCKCSTSEPAAPQQQAPQLQLLATFSLNVPEPSGLSLGSEAKSLWTVSDQTNRIYRLDLSGKVLQTLAYTGIDLEGVVFDTTRKVLWVAEEQTREIVKVDLSGAELERHRILNGQDNSGLEGICLDSSGTIFLLKEKNPGLFIELNRDFSVKQQLELGFAGDYSGICCAGAPGEFWIVSDQSQMVYRWSRKNGVSERYSLPINKAEGVAYNVTNGRLYVVSDSEAKLYVFSLSKK